MSRKASGKREGSGFLIVGILLFLGAFGLTLYNRLESDRAGRDSAHAAEQILDLMKENGIEMVPADEIEKDPYAANRIEGNDYGEENEEPEEIPMPEMEVDGDGYIGILTIPSLGITLPVMAEWDYERLKHAPCRYYGSYYTDDLVIAGHNYARHFSPVKWIDIGAEVTFTAVNGLVFEYYVDNLENVQPDEVERLTSGSWDLTLFTCNTGGQSRKAVRCVRVR